METAIINKKTINGDCYNPELDKIKAEDYFPEKLEKAKAYFREHGVPDFDKILREAEQKKK